MRRVRIVRPIVAEINGNVLGKLLITAGVDNLFDRLYAEHVNKAEADIGDYLQNVRVNNPAAPCGSRPT